MPRPSKRKRASRKNILKAHAKMKLLRSLRSSLDSNEASKGTGSTHIVKHVGLSQVVTEDEGHARVELQDNLDVVVRSGVVLRLDERPDQVFSVSIVPDKVRAAAEDNRSHAYQERTDSIMSANQSAEWKVHKESLVKNSHPEGNNNKVSVDTKLVQEDEGGLLATAARGAEVTRSTEKSSKSYLKFYKETFRASKRMKVTQISTTGGDPWKRGGMLTTFETSSDLN
ncbi:unnamed protein product [Rhizoctonia solani]|uniref:Uncharacterized protein n=1 Tax=Rhizoctonia solani TaxID=456999 RepID=A0A8H2WB81_9AGAM|nr:unnamed protein product [Rhizoctonia solani]